MNIDDNIDLSGASIDVLHALFFRGPLVAGDLPSKSGASDLVGLGLATTSKIAAFGDNDDLFTYLTAPGQAYAIKFLVETNFGHKKPVEEGTITIIIKVDVAPVIEQIDAARHAIEHIFKDNIRPGGSLRGR